MSCVYCFEYDEQFSWPCSGFLAHYCVCYFPLYLSPMHCFIGLQTVGGEIPLAVGIFEEVYYAIGVS